MLHFVFVHLFNSNRKFNVIIISIIIVIKIIWFGSCDRPKASFDRFPFEHLIYVL